MGPPGISGLYFLSHSLAVLFVLWPRPTTDPGAGARRFIVSAKDALLLRLNTEVCCLVV
jgi:hypothetical protein